MLLFAAAVLSGVLAGGLPGVPGAVARADTGQVLWAEKVQPFLEYYCFDCHDDTLQRGDVDLTQASGPDDLIAGFDLWEKAMVQFRDQQMPPASAEQPPEKERLAAGEAMLAILERYREGEPTDPGPTHVRRLTAEEFRRSVRDLTGIDTDWTKGFPADPAGGEGFTNHASTLYVSPMWMEKLLVVGNRIASHASITPSTGIRFYDAPVGERTDSQYLKAMKAHVAVVRGRILEGLGVYEDDADAFPRYALALWRNKQAAALGKGVSPKVLAQEQGLDPDLLKKASRFIDQSRDKDATGLLRILRSMPRPGKTEAAAQAADEQAQQAVKQAGQYIRDNRQALKAIFAAPSVKRKNTAAGVTDEGRRYVLMLRDSELKRRVPGAFKELEHALNDVKMASSPSRGALIGQARDHLFAFAEKAYRRPINAGERRQLVRYLDDAWDEFGAFEMAMRQTIKRVIVSPNFLFRIEEASVAKKGGAGGEPVPVSPNDLAIRLSYFLWSSLPDQALRDRAASGRLHDEQALVEEVRRMLQAPQAEALGSLFFSQWLGYQQLFEHPGLDESIYPEADDTLKEAMFAQASAYVLDLIRRDGSLLELIDSEHTFVNQDLASLYGIEGIQGDAMQRIDCDRSRGGILGWGATHWTTAMPDRTSPVKRGAWVLETILGTPPPPPPANVSQLEEENANDQNLTVRERLEVHRDNPNCAACHSRIDPIGFAMDGFDALGRQRTMDELNRPIDDVGQSVDGQKMHGVNGLKDNVKTQKALFIRHAVRQTLGYALGRAVGYYDQPTIRQIEEKLAEDNYKVSTLFVEVSKSLPFRYRRPENAATARNKPLDQGPLKESS